MYFRHRTRPLAGQGAGRSTDISIECQLPPCSADAQAPGPPGAASARLPFPWSQRTAALFLPVNITSRDNQSFILHRLITPNRRAAAAEHTYSSVWYTALIEHHSYSRPGHAGLRLCSDGLCRFTAATSSEASSQLARRARSIWCTRIWCSPPRA